MAEDCTPEEPDPRKHLRNVLDDLWERHCDGPDEAFEAIMEHPGFKNVVGLKLMKTMPVRGGN